jgi:hypothetical protein
MDEKDVASGANPLGTQRRSTPPGGRVFALRADRRKEFELDLWAARNHAAEVEGVSLSWM